MTETVVSKAPRIQRRNHGKGHSYLVDGLKVPGATTIVGKGYPKYLEAWAARQSAGYAVDNWDELSEMKISERMKLIENARFADRDAAARRGTEVHDVAQRLAAGEDVDVPDELVGHVDAYLRFVEEWKPKELFVETPIANVTCRYCGTIDIVADLADGNRWLLDLKTTRSGIFRETALQLAAYRYAEWYSDADGEAQPMIAVDRVGAIWLKGDRSYELVPVDASPATFLVFRYCAQIMAFSERDDVVGAPLAPPELEESAA